LKIEILISSSFLPAMLGVSPAKVNHESIRGDSIPTLDDETLSIDAFGANHSWDPHWSLRKSLVGCNRLQSQALNGGWKHGARQPRGVPGNHWEDPAEDS